MAKISQLPADNNPRINDLLALVNSATNVTQRMTVQDFSKIIDTLLNPAGIIQQTAATIAPAGWLICDGSAISRATFPALFTAIGITFGSGDGATTFNIPNGKGRSLFGRDTAQTEFDTLGEIGGQKDVMAHSHSTGKGNDNNLGGGYGWQSTDDSYGLHAIGVTGAGVNNLNPYIVINHIIKT